MPPAVHSWVTLLWTHDPKTSLKGGWVGQWSGRNRAQAETSQRFHKRPHISDSAAQERREGGEWGGCGGLVFSIRNMHEREKEREREREKEGSLLSLTFCPPGVFFSVGPCKSYIPYILSSGSISFLTMLGPGSALSSEERLTGDS